VSVLGIGHCLVVVVMMIEIAKSPTRVMARRALAVMGASEGGVAAVMPSTEVMEVAVKSVHRANILTAANSRLSSKGPDRVVLSERALKTQTARTPSKLMTRGDRSVPIPKGSCGSATASSTPQT
jgi:hypothetical protein